MPTAARARRTLALSVGLCLPATLAACSSAPAAHTAPIALPSCRPAEPAQLPHAAGSLTQNDTGTYCLGVGQTLDVFLTAPSSSAHLRWSQIEIADTSVLGYGNSGVLTPPVTVTPGVLVGVSRGESTITSSLPGGQTWTATIVVS